MAVAEIPRRISQKSASSKGQYGTATSLVLTAPLLVLLLFTFVYPVGRLLWQSVFAPDFTLVYFARAVTEPLYLTILLRTFEIALYVTVLTLLLGYPVALAMARARSRTTALIAVCVLVPLWTSILVRSYAWIVLLQRNGLINKTLTGAGIIDAPLQLLYTEAAVILAMTHVLMPFMILPIYSALRSIPDDLVKAARNLGANGVQAFLRITLPLSLTGVAAGTLLTFILALGFYVTPALVGGPQTLMMSTLIAQQTTELLNWPFASALATILLFATLLLVVLFRRTLTFTKGV